MRDSKQEVTNIVSAFRVDPFSEGRHNNIDGVKNGNTVDSLHLYLQGTRALGLR